MLALSGKENVATMQNINVVISLSRSSTLAVLLAKPAIHGDQHFVVSSLYNGIRLSPRSAQTRDGNQVVTIEMIGAKREYGGGTSLKIVVEARVVALAWGLLMQEEYASSLRPKSLDGVHAD